MKVRQLFRCTRLPRRLMAVSAGRTHARRTLERRTQPQRNSKKGAAAWVDLRAGLRVLGVAGLLWSMTVPAMAAPSGGNVVGGEGSIRQEGLNTTVEQATDRLAIDWDNFDVAVDEKVTFVQPGADSLALNRILSEDPSRILGMVEANGRIILANPNGILFGAGARLDVNSLIASGLAIEAADFMQGELHFVGAEGSLGQVTNHGVINAAAGGNVALLGQQVTNTGSIQATLGRVALASAHEAVVTFDQNGLLGVQVDVATLSSELEGTYGVVNMGDITAEGGGILLTASAAADLFSQAVNRGEYRDATSAILEEDGSFTLGAGRGVYNNGHLDVSSPNRAAGVVALAGERVTNNGVISADSDSAAAGKIHLQASNRLHLNAASVMSASSDQASGKIVLEGDSVNATPGALVETTGYASYGAFSVMRLPHTHARHALVRSLGSTVQAGALTVAENLHLQTLLDADVRLLNPGNALGSLSLDSQYVSNITVVERDDLVLRGSVLRDSTLTLDLIGEGAELTQAAGASLDLHDTLVNLAAPSVFLGQGGAASTLSSSALDIRFTDRIATNGSIDLGGTGSFSSVSIRDASNSLRLFGNEVIDLGAQITEAGIDISAMEGRAATIETFGSLTQSGAIVLTENLDVRASAYLDLILDHPDNQVASLNADIGYSSLLRLVNAGDLLLRNIQLDGATMELSVRGAVEQQTDTMIAGLEGAATISADSIFLGARGTSAIELLDIGYLSLSFSDWLVIDGPIRLGGEYSSFYVNGTDADNGVIVGEYGLFDSRNSFVKDHYLNLGAGDDEIVLLRSFNVPVFLGEGADNLYVADLEVFYDLPDFTFGEDEVLVLTP